MWRLGSGKSGSWQLLYLRRNFIQSYLNILQALSNNGISYVVIGTWALKKKYPAKLSDYPVKDCDLMIDPSFESIIRTVAVLTKSNWSVKVWEVEINETVQEDFLKSKFYLRARQDELTLDITYECPFIPWQELIAHKELYSGIPLASTDHILHLKELKGTDRDRKIIYLFRPIESTRPAV